MFKCSAKPWEARKQIVIVILRDVSMISYLFVFCQGGEMQRNVKSSLS